MKSQIKIKAKRYAMVPALLSFVFLIATCSLSVKKPNVILIVCDQLSPRAMGWTGETEVITPNLDQFADAAYCFTNAYCTSPAGDPARHSLFTGVYPSQHWVLKNNMNMKEGLPSIVSMLNNRNYITGNIGEMLNASLHKREVSQRSLNQEFMIDHGGFSTYTAYLKSELVKRNLDFTPYEHLSDGKIGMQENDGLAKLNTLPEELTLEHWLTDEALKFLDNQKENHPDNPFFLHVSYCSLHQPYFPVETYANMYLDKMEELKLPPNFSFEELEEWCKANPDGPDSLTVEDVKYLRAIYFGFVTQLDAAIGELFRGIKERGLMENSIIVFTSDHGDNLGEHGRFYENNMLEASVRVPLMLSFPGAKLAERKIIDDNVSHIDVVTMFLSAAGVSPSESLAGRDLRHLIEEKENWTDHSVYAEFYKYGVNPSQLMLRKGDYKLTYNIENEDGMFEMRLYNIKEDPWELKDLSESPDHGLIFSDMSDELMNDYWKKISSSLPQDLLSSSNFYYWEKEKVQHWDLHPMYLPFTARSLSAKTSHLNPNLKANEFVAGKL